jgi:hypothetical protein
MMWREQLATLSREYTNLNLPRAEAADGPLVLHWALIGGSIGLLNREILLGLALRKLGARPRIVLCDAVCSGCQIRTFSPEDSIQDWRRICGNCMRVGKQMVEAAGLESIRLSELVSEADRRVAREMADRTDFNELRVLERDGYQLGLYAMSAAIRYFRALPHVVPHEQLEPIFREYMYTALISMRASQTAVERIRPDVYLTTHNIYSEWGPAYKTFTANGTPVYWHIASILQGHIMIRRCDGEYTSHPYYCDDERWRELSAIPLNRAQEADLDSFMDIMCEGKNSLMEYFSEAPQSPESLRRRFDIPKGGKVWGIFSPLPWDAHLSADPLLFNDVDEWLVRCIECAAEVRDVTWVVKMHPTESIRDSRMSMEKVLREAFPVLPDNVRLITGKDRINTFGLIDLLDGGITTRGTTGMELVLHGKQAMASGSSHYGFKGFTLDSRDTEEFFAHMRSASGLGSLAAEKRELARRYAYDFFIRRNLPFDLYDQKSMAVNAEALKGLQRGEPSMLRTMCEAMLGKCSGSVERPDGVEFVAG